MPVFPPRRQIHVFDEGYLSAFWSAEPTEMKVECIIGMRFPRELVGQARSCVFTFGMKKHVRMLPRLSSILQNMRYEREWRTHLDER